MHRLFLALLSALLSAPAFAQTPKDRVYFRDQAAGKVTDLEGEVVESAAGVKFTGADKKERTIPAADLVRIEYGALDPVIRQAATPQEADADPAKPFAYYTAKLKDLPANATEKTRRFVQFREAYWGMRAADAKGSFDEFKADGRKAADKAAAFVKANKKTWEQWPLGRTAARVYGELGDWKAVDDVLKELAGVPDAPAELKADAGLARVGYTLRAGNFDAAKSLLAEVERDASAGAAQERAAIYKEALAALPPKDTKAKPAAVAKIESLIAKAKDPAVRATGYGVLGEVYLAHNMPRDAQWSYLWVDTVYTQDADERVRAVHRLISLFAEADADGEKPRADQFRERLPKIR